MAHTARNRCSAFLRTHLLAVAVLELQPAPAMASIISPEFRARVYEGFQRSQKIDLFGGWDSKRKYRLSFEICYDEIAPAYDVHPDQQIHPRSELASRDSNRRESYLVRQDNTGQVNFGFVLSICSMRLRSANWRQAAFLDHFVCDDGIGGPCVPNPDPWLGIPLGSYRWIECDRNEHWTR